jgi:ribosomal protein L29
LENPNVIGQYRKSIARILTELRKRELEEIIAKA